MLKHIISTSALVAVALGATASTMDFSYTPGVEEFDFWGTGKVETYSVAIKIDDASLVGKKVSAINVPVMPGSELSDCSAFVMKGLDGKKGVPANTVALQEFTATEGVVRVAFDSPWTIEEGGFYAGYSFKIANVKDNESNKYPVAAVGESVADAFYVTTSRTYSKWVDKSSLGALCMSVEIEGEFPQYGCGVQSLGKVFTLPGTAATGTVKVVNHGTDDLNDIDILYTANGLSKETHYTFPVPVSGKYFGQTADVTFDVPVIEELGFYEGTLKITKVNGHDNADSEAEASGPCNVMQELPNHCVVMEEYTGTWCGYCPRGWVAMKLLNEALPNNYVAISYHNGDPMQVTSVYPSSISGYPSAYLDRVWDVDPYFGSGTGNMDIEKDVMARLAMDVPVSVSVTAELNEDQTEISGTAKVMFLESLEENPYQVAYMVTADGLTGEDSADWGQHNYYKGNTGYGPEMDQFTQGPSTQILVYDDVLVAFTDFNGIEGSLPDSAKAGELADAPEQSFTIADMVCTDSSYRGEPVVQNPEMLNMIALVIDKNTGAIVNAAKTPVKEHAGVKAIGNDALTVVATCCYDLSGRRLSQAPEAGMYIMVKRYSDGSIRSYKRLAR